MNARKKSAWVRGVVRVALLASFTALACSGDKPNRKGQIMLAVQTDMSIPDDVSHIRILVFKNGANKFDTLYQVGPDNQIPATLGLIASDDPEDTVEVRVLGYQRTTARTLNRVVTTIPQDRVATLNIPIQWLCWNQVIQNDSVTGSADSSCENPDQACIAGECRDVELDSATLPTFTLADIQGGSEEPATGRCLDTVPCFDLGRDVASRQGCTIAVTAAEAERLNVAVTLPPGRGICSAETGNCYIPLDRDETYGWRPIDGPPPPLEGGNGGAGSDATGLSGDGGLSGAGGASALPDPTGSVTIQLPAAVCARVASGEANSIRVTGACETKTAAHPTCGPWTVIGTQNENNGPLGSGVGPLPPPGTECPALYAPNPMRIASDPDADRFAHLVLELVQTSNRLLSEVGMACGGINNRIAGTPTSYAGAVPTPAELETACTAASNNIGPSETRQFQLISSPGHCRANTDDQLALEAQCENSTCISGTLEERCSSLLSSCNGDCTGVCWPTGNELTVDCSGGCDGQCIGSCSGTCTGPGGNPLPPATCMGVCSGVCTGSCQGQCSGNGPCAGDCEGNCSGTTSAEGCEIPLSLNNCGQSAACEYMASAAAGIRQTCSPSSVFVSGPSPPDVAPAITDNYPRLFQVILQSSSLSSALSALSVAGSTLTLDAVTNQTPDAACLSEATSLLGQAAQAFSTAFTQASNVFIGSGSGAGACLPASGEDACSACGKASCCTEAVACSMSGPCLLETSCLKSCALSGGTRASCEVSCMPEGTAFDQATDTFSDCFFSACAGCSVSKACSQINSDTIVDDFDDGNLNSTFGIWRLTTPIDGSLANQRPGANASAYGLAVSGGPSPGISIDFPTCMTAPAVGGISFEGIDNNMAFTELTVRLRTTETEPPALGGNCTGADCGDYFQTTLQLNETWTNYPLSWSVFANSRDLSPAPSSGILGIDFVSVDPAAGNFAIDNLRFGLSAAAKLVTGASL